MAGRIRVGGSLALGLRHDVDMLLRRFMGELHRRGMRLTSQRIGVARIVLNELGDHPSFKRILERAREEMPNVSSSTVYNTLKLLESLGFIQSFSLRSETRYDCPHPHVNVACINSGSVADMEYEESQELVRMLEERLGVKIRNIVVYAEC